MQKTPEDLSRLLAECAAHVARLKHALTEHSINPTRDEALALVHRYEEEFFALALLARPLANSWRNFDVGAVGVGLKPVRTPGFSPWAIRFAANTKEQHGKKYCGEQRLLDAALKRNWSHMLAVFVAGEPQPDHGSGKVSDTLTPCEVCRWRFRGLYSEQSPILQPDTLVHCINSSDPQLRERYTLASLHEFHCDPL